MTRPVATGGRRAFPLLYARKVADTVAFYERLGFTRRVQHPSSGEPTFIALVRDGAELAVSAIQDTTTWKSTSPDGPGRGGIGRPCEMFVFVETVDATLRSLRGEGVPVLGEPKDMPWGERVARVADPDGNTVALASIQGCFKVEDVRHQH